jgi:hypothetical protein
MVVPLYSTNLPFVPPISHRVPFPAIACTFWVPHDVLPNKVLISEKVWPSYLFKEALVPPAKRLPLGSAAIAVIPLTPMSFRAPDIFV